MKASELGRSIYVNLLITLIFFACITGFGVLTAPFFGLIFGSIQITLLALAMLICNIVILFGNLVILVKNGEI